MTEENLARVAAMAATVAELDKSARKQRKDALQQATLLDQRNAAIDALAAFLHRSGEQYVVEQLTELPPLLSIEAAARLCGLEVGTAYYLSRHEWGCFIKRFGTNGRAVRTKELLKWIATEED